MLSFNSVLGYFKAGGYDSTNLVDRNMKEILTAVNGGAAFLAILLMIMYLLFCLKWPVNTGTIKELAIGYRYILADIRNA
mmetsp:Transcript_20849/g.3372  ORF Transcript_20849/g.3372 Transcript_20849/m.3372 type:complete len:80 (+) Transcript_20849:921-1160(+)